MTTERTETRSRFGPGDPPDERRETTDPSFESGPEVAFEATRSAIERGEAKEAEVARLLRKRGIRLGIPANARGAEMLEMVNKRREIARDLWELRRLHERLEEILTAGKGGASEPVEGAAAPPPGARRD